MLLCAVPRCSVCGRSRAATTRATGRRCGSHGAPVCVAHDAHHPPLLLLVPHSALAGSHPKLGQVDTADVSSRVEPVLLRLCKIGPAPLSQQLWAEPIRYAAPAIGIDHQPAFRGRRQVHTNRRQICSGPHAGPASQLANRTGPSQDSKTLPGRVAATPHPRRNLPVHRKPHAARNRPQKQPRKNGRQHVPRAADAAPRRRRPDAPRAGPAGRHKSGPPAQIQ